MRKIAREFLDHLDDLLRDARRELSARDPRDPRDAWGTATVDKLCAHLQAASGVIGSAAHDRARDALQAAGALRWDETDLAMDDVSALCQETEETDPGPLELPDRKDALDRAREHLLSIPTKRLAKALSVAYGEGGAYGLRESEQQALLDAHRALLGKGTL